MAMNCEEAGGLLIDRLLDELDPTSDERLDAHLAGCPACAVAAREMSEVWDALGESSAAPAGTGTLVRFGRRLERGRPGTRVPAPLLAAAAAALLAGGVVVGHALAPDGPVRPSGERIASPGPVPSPETVPPAREDGPRFLMLLRGDEPDRRHPRERLVDEYSAWAEELAAAGVLVSAEELDPETAEWVAPDTLADRETARVAGYFLVEAPSYDSALAMARASPHAAYGGLIEVRRIAGGR